MKALVSSYDAALFDLDGVVYLGPNAIDGVTRSLAKLREVGTRLGFVTNNAARTPAAVAEHLRKLGIQADDSDVVNSTQATVRMLRGELPVGAKVLCGLAGVTGLGVSTFSATFLEVSAITGALSNWFSN